MRIRATSPGELVEQARAEVTRVAAHRHRLTVRALLPGVEDVPGGDRRPLRFELDADRAAAEMDRLDERGPDPAHRIEDELAGLAVAADRLARERGQHLARMGGRGGEVAVPSLHAAGRLRDRPHRQRGD